jgi:hypothetical protein
MEIRARGPLCPEASTFSRKFRHKIDEKIKKYFTAENGKSVFSLGIRETQ